MCGTGACTGARPGDKSREDGLQGGGTARLQGPVPPGPTMSHHVPARPCLQCGGLSRPVLESCQAGSSRREGQEEEEELGADHAALHCSSASVGNLGVNILIE